MEARESYPQEIQHIHQLVNLEAIEQYTQQRDHAGDSQSISKLIGSIGNTNTVV